MRRFYQFTIDGRPAAPIREQKRIAYQDAVSAGYASWTSDRKSIRLEYSQCAEITAIEWPEPAKQ